MAPTAPSTSRRRRGLAAAAAAALVLPVLAAVPASAQTTTTTERAGATQASAVRLTINLPQGNQVLVDLSTASGTVRSVTGTGPEAQALANLVRASIAGQTQQSPVGAEAKLPAPKKSSSPTNAVSDGINSSPLGAFLQVGAVTASAEVTEAPTSVSTAEIANLSLGLPVQVADALKPVLDALLAGLDQIITQLQPVDAATKALCTGIAPVTGPVGGGVSAVPVLGPVLKDVVVGVTDPEAGLLCNLRVFLGNVRTQLADSLKSLTAPGGLLRTGLIGATQTIGSEGTKTTARSTASLADLRVLGQNPFVGVNALTTTSTAVLDGGTADATVDVVGVQAFSRGLLTIDTDLTKVTGDLAGIDIDGLSAVLAQVQTLLNALAGIGIEGGRLGDPGAALTGCPENLAGQLSGTFEGPGACAAAAGRGFGLAVTLPAALAGPLGITGPVVALQVAPAAAVVRGSDSSSSTTTTTPTAPGTSRGPLPRTGGEAPLAAAGLVLLLGAALVRRRRAGVTGA